MFPTQMRGRSISGISEAESLIYCKTPACGRTKCPRRQYAICCDEGMKERGQAMISQGYRNAGNPQGTGECAGVTQEPDGREQQLEVTTHDTLIPVRHDPCEVTARHAAGMESLMRGV